ncbi:MAG: hypothetical protein WC503_00685 [Candidatus Shapirobacteria bacterium]
MSTLNVNILTSASNDKITLSNKIEINGTDMIITGGTGSPEGIIVAVPGSLYLRSDGGANTSLYVKESGISNTGWVAK